jgi:hypothetical protein
MIAVNYLRSQTLTKESTFHVSISSPQSASQTHTPITYKTPPPRVSPPPSNPSSHPTPSHHSPPSRSLQLISKSTMTSNNGSKKSKSGYAKKIKGVFGFGKSKPKVQVVPPAPGTAGRNPVSGKKDEVYIQDPKKETSPAKGKISGAGNGDLPAGGPAKGNSKGQAKSGSETPVEGTSLYPPLSLSPSSPCPFAPWSRD